MGEVASQISAPKQSRVGKIPVPVPKGVTVTLGDGKCAAKGPLGALELALPPSVSVRREGDYLLVHSSASGANAPRLQGLGRALLANMVKGCERGYEKVMELRGVGYRAELKGEELHLSLGLSHPVAYTLPKGVKVELQKESKGTIFQLTSMDKELLGRVCAAIRSFRPPEPYGGKGVCYRGERVKRKAGKAGKK